MECLCSKSPKKQTFLHILHDNTALTRFLEPASDFVGTHGTTARLPSAELHDQHSGIIGVNLRNQVMPVK